MKRPKSTAKSRLPTAWPARWLAIAALALIGLGWYGWRLARTPDPPVIPLDGIDRPVAEALLAARQVVVQEPRSARAWGRLGMLFYTHGFGPQAEPCLEQAARLAPAEARWPYLQALNRHGRTTDDSLGLIRQAMERNPDDSAIRLRCSEELIQQGSLDEAALHVRHVIQTDPDNPWARYLLGQIALHRGDLAESLQQLKRSLSAAPHARCTHLAMAIVLQRQGNPRGAAAARRDAAKLSSDFPWADPHAEAAEELNAGIPARIAFARQLLAQGRSAEALDILHAAARLEPADATIRVQLGMALLGLDNAAAAEGPLREAVTLDPASADARFQLAICFKRQGKHQDATEQLRHMTQLVPSDALGQFHLGMCLKALGQRGEAERALERAARFRPDIAPVHRELGILLAEDDRWKESVVHLRRALQLAPQDQAAQEWLARSRANAGEGQGQTSPAPR